MALGLAGLGVADRNSLAGVVRAHSFEKANRTADFRLAIGARLVFCDGAPDILSFPTDRAAYGRLTRLLTRGNSRAQKGACLLRLGDLFEAAEGQQLIVMPASTWDERDGARRAAKIYPDLSGADLYDGNHEMDVMAALERLREATGGRVWLAATMTYGQTMRRDLGRRIALAARTRLPLLAVNDALMHVPARRPLLDVLTAIREGEPLDRVGLHLEANAERHIKSGAEMARLFADAPEAIGQTLRFLEGARFSLDELRGDYPEELREGFATPQAALEFFAREGAKFRYPNGVPAHVEKAIAHELPLVEELDYAPYFLTVHDIVRFARSRQRFSARAAARRRIRRSASVSALRRSIPPFTIFCSSASSRPSATNRPTSTSISSMSGAKKSCNISMIATAARGRA